MHHIVAPGFVDRPAGVTALLARWTEKLAGGPQGGTSDSPPLARVMGVGRQQAVKLWADSNRLSLIHNAKLPKSFNSEIWKKGYNPDLIFVSSNISDTCEKSVLDPIPRTKHRPICVTVHPVIGSQPTPFRRCINLRKAKWDDFSTDFDEAIEDVEPVPENYDRFIGLIRVVSRRHIPRGCRTNYIPGLTEESQSLYEAYKKQYSSNPFAERTLETGNKLIDTMKEKNKKRWEEVITSIDLTHNSRKV